MATYQQTIRRGLPRVAGGPGWPDVEGAVTASAATVFATTVAQDPVAPETSANASGVPASVHPVPANVVEAAGSTASVSAEASELAESAMPGGATVPLRRGLPRVEGGEPWPAAGEVSGVAASGGQLEQAPSSAVAESAIAQDAAVSTSADAVSSAAPAVAVSDGSIAGPAVATVSATVAAGAAAVETVAEEVALRRGLPRVAGGEPWPILETATVQRVVAVQPLSTVPPEAPVSPAVSGSETVAAQPVETVADPAPAAASAAATEPVALQGASAAARPTPATQAKPAATTPASDQKKPVREPRMIGSRTLAQWVKLGVWGVIGAILAAGIVVLAARGVTTLPGVPEFLEQYPGEYHIPDVAEPGFPAWARWTHFLNIFLMVLIIRSGLQVRQQTKPPAFWRRKRGGWKISIYLWLHTSLDVLWMLNGAVFIVLLFVSGHWARIVPTSWEVFPNALSALLQYLTLEWPLENGWVNYNSLQQIMYFLVVFVAAPLAIITGLRMSEWWPQKAEKLNKIYPAPLARAIHFPTMLFFVLFILIHVFLVFTTGALRNLNHMFAGTDEVNWVGFWWFAAGLFVTVAAVFLARPLVLAPIASLTGKVSNR